MTKESVDKTQEIVGPAGEVSQIQSEILGSLSKIADLMNKIRQALAQETKSIDIDEVNTALAQIDKVTQETSSAAQESELTSQELAGVIEMAKKSAECG